MIALAVTRVSSKPSSEQVYKALPAMYIPPPLPLPYFLPNLCEVMVMGKLEKQGGGGGGGGKCVKVGRGCRREIA